MTGYTPAFITDPEAEVKIIPGSNSVKHEATCPIVVGNSQLPQLYPEL